VDSKPAPPETERTIPLKYTKHLFGLQVFFWYLFKWYKKMAEKEKNSDGFIHSDGRG